MRKVVFGMAVLAASLLALSLLVPTLAAAFPVQHHQWVPSIRRRALEAAYCLYFNRASTTIY